jgi:hypothetical protein
MKRLGSLLLLNLATLMVFASAALADAENDHGEGWFGETTDWDITVAGYILIAGFPTFLLLASLLMWRLDKRKDMRKAAEKARAARADTRGGW